MSAIHSTRWHRVARLRPRLSPWVRVRRQTVRGESWRLLTALDGSGSVRLNTAAYALAGRLDGERSLQQLWDERLASGDDPPTQDEVIDMLATLREAGLLQSGAESALPAPVRQVAEDDEAPHLAKPSASRPSLLAWRIRLFDPSRWLSPRWAQRLFTLPVGLAWLTAVATLAWLTLQHGSELAAYAATALADPRSAVLGLALYLPLKLMHEAAHALAVLRWGGQVHAAGVTLMLGLPVPWVDASAANAFPQRRQRALVAAAGIAAELAVAALAVPAWLTLPDGLARQAAFTILLIAGVSTLLFNANPLQRLDGYYLATDLLGLPNLATRSRRWWLQATQRWFAGPSVGEPMVVARGETPWLALYAPLSATNALVIAALAVLWLGQVSFALGCAAALLLGWQSVVRPAWSFFGELRRGMWAAPPSRRAGRRLALAAMLLLGALLVPWPQRTLVQGVIWPQDDAQLRADEDGFVSELLAADGTLTETGQPVLQLANPALQVRRERQVAQVESLQAEWAQALSPASDAADGAPADVQAKLAAAEAELYRLDERLAALTVRARSSGRITLPNASDLQGSYLKRGTLVGQVLGDAVPTVRVALPEADAGGRTAGVATFDVRLASAPANARPAQLLRDAPAAVRQLPSAALSQRHGGPVPTDPADRHDLTPMQPVLLLDLALADGGAAPRLGERAWVRVDRGWAPVGWQLVQSVRSALLRRFNPAF